MFRHILPLILISDLTDESSFTKADYWVNQILTNEPVSLQLLQ